MQAVGAVQGPGGVRKLCGLIDVKGVSAMGVARRVSQEQCLRGDCGCGLGGEG